MINSRNIEDLREDVAKACHMVIDLAKKQGIKIIITSTIRDDEYQLLLYGKGRWTKGNIVTNAKQPTFHWNKAGLAFDFCPVDEKGNCLWDRLDLFKKVGEIGESIGLEWSGRWTKFPEMAHLQWSGYDKEFTSAMVRKKDFPPKLILKGEIMEDKKQPHWAQTHYDNLVKKGVEITETRFDDNVTRGELFALLDRVVSIK